MVVTWITEDDVQAALGMPVVGATDLAWLTQVTSAANDWAYDNVRRSGQEVTEVAPPSSAHFLGTVLYGVALYKERGAIESFASYEGWQAAANIGNLAQIKRLLGLYRPAVDKAKSA